MKHDAASDVATNDDDDSISPFLSKCDRVRCFFGWSR